MTKDTVHEIVVEAIVESKEKDKRKPNLMMFNMKESTSTVREERIEYGRANVIKVLSYLADTEDLDSRILKVIRMGRKGDNERRPIKVIFDSPNIKFSFLQKAYKLKQAEDVCIKEIQISNDRTPNEIRQYRQLRDELVRRKTNEPDLVIRKGKIMSSKSASSNSQQDNDENNKEVNNESTSNGESDLNFSKESDVNVEPSSAMLEDRLAIDNTGAGAFSLSPVKFKGPEPITVRPLQDLLLPVYPNQHL